MQTIKHGGLAGKARRVRGRNRAARLQACQMMHEYFDPDTEEVFRNRYIPIRGRAEFVPSALQENDNDMALEQPNSPGEQLQLSLAVGQQKPDRQTTRWATLKNKTSRPHGKREEVIRFPTRGGRTTPTQRNRASGEKYPAERLTLRGFLLGCAMGSAAAAVLLLMVRTAVG